MLTPSLRKLWLKSDFLPQLAPILEWRPLTRCQSYFLALLYQPKFHLRPEEDPLAFLDHLFPTWALVVAAGERIASS